MKLIDYLSAKGFEYVYSEHSKRYVLMQQYMTLPLTYKTTKDTVRKTILDYWEKQNIDKYVELSKISGYEYFMGEMINTLKENSQKIQAQKAAKKVELLGGFQLEMPDPDELLKLYPKEGGKDPILWDLKHNELLDVPVKSYENIVKDEAGKDIRVSYNESGFYSTIYDPTPGADIVTQMNDGDKYYLRLNMYKSPSWVKNYAELRKDACIPPVIEKYLNVFFMHNTMTIERVLDWFAAAMFDKDPLMLCLVSPSQGTGKSLMADLFGSLHAEGRYYKPPASVFESMFNHSLYMKTLVMIEEIKANNGSAKENIKRMVGNVDITTRKMHSDQGSKIDHPLSVMCTTNKPSDIGLDGQGRRFFIPNVTAEHISKTMEQDEINKLHALKSCFKEDGNEEHRQEMAKFAWWLYERYLTNGVKDVTELEKIKPENFWICQRACMPQWQRLILDYLLEGGATDDCPEGTILTLDHFRVHLEEQRLKILPSANTIKDFLTTHEWKGYTLATVDEKKPSKDSHVYPNIDENTVFGMNPYDRNYNEDLL